MPLFIKMYSIFDRQVRIFGYFDVSHIKYGILYKYETVIASFTVFCTNSTLKNRYNKISEVGNNSDPAYFDVSKF